MNKFTFNSQNILSKLKRFQLTCIFEQLIQISKKKIKTDELRCIYYAVNYGKCYEILFMIHFFKYFLKNM